MPDSSLQSSKFPSSDFSQRYASALFELGGSQEKITLIEKDLNNIRLLIDSNEDLMFLIRSPIFSIDDQRSAFEKILAKAGIQGLIVNFINVIILNRRLFALPCILSAFHHMLLEMRGEISVTVRISKKLSTNQKKKLKSTLDRVTGKNVSLDVIVDPSLLGGMVLRIGSLQVDTSLKTQLSSLKLALKEVV
ncbi:F0F1 ATP synthase subunit delta [Candidatus Endowatersipora endosymbiont of Watersipora subatra]|uniref:F0F1 ATP synthase subunit delta n=1 Tax=Candidatus Endowatersipora endosymbiont of Watersipora subatra TaxID=3077946 RepID=UPI00312CC00B